MTEKSHAASIFVYGLPLPLEGDLKPNRNFQGSHILLSGPLGNPNLEQGEVPLVMANVHFLTCMYSSNDAPS